MTICACCNADRTRILIHCRQQSVPASSSHKRMESLVLGQVREFWHDLEAATNERQAAMFRMLNGHLTRLGRRIEAAVGELLDVHLEPATLKLEPPSAQQFHADLQQLFDAGAACAFASCFLDAGAFQGMSYPISCP